jgi:hypothetical protein
VNVTHYHHTHFINFHTAEVPCRYDSNTIQVQECEDEVLMHCELHNYKHGTLC